ncbi:MAG: PIG-L deacetylase family protein [Aestuariivirga sp.]
MISSIEAFGRTLVIAPHPDDDVLGAGGTMAKIARSGQDVHVVVVTTGKPPAYSAESVARVRAEAAEAHGILGVKTTSWLDLPAAQLPEVANAQLNGTIRDAVTRISPRTIFAPFPGDIHIDHQLVFLSTLVASRPHQAEFPATLLAYETLSETNWNAPYITPPFVPNVFLDIEATLDKKLAAMRAFSSQLRAAPHERSLEALQALATLRGATVHRAAAEAFVLVRHAG